MNQIKNFVLIKTFIQNKFGWIAFIFLTLTCLVPFAIFQFESSQAVRLNKSDLEEHTQQKANQLKLWLNQRQGDAILLQRNPDFFHLIQDPSAFNHQSIEELFSHIQRRMGYESIVIYDQDEKSLLSSGSLPTLQSFDKKSISTVKKTRLSWYLDHQQQVHTLLIIPIRDPESFYVIGHIVLSQPLNNDLLPRLETKTDTDSDSYTLILNTDQHEIITVKIPTRNPSRVTAQMLLFNGDTHTLDPLIQKGIENTSATELIEGKSLIQLVSHQPVPFSTLHVLLEKDMNEVIQPLRYRFYSTMLLFGMGSLILILIMFIQWRQQKYQFDIDVERKTAEKDRILHHFFDMPLFGMAITHAKSGRWLRFNERFCDLLGYSADELHQITLIDLIKEEERHQEMHLLKDMEAGLLDSYQLEKRYLHKSGEVVYVLADTCCVRSEGRIDFIIHILEDITTRKQAEIALNKQNKLFNMLSHTNQSIVHCQNLNELFFDICKIIVDEGGFKLSLLAHYDERTNALNLLRNYGEDAGFCNQMLKRRTQNPQLLEQSGILQAVQKNDAVIFNDYLSMSEIDEYRDLANLANIQSAAYYPIYHYNKIFGVLAVYADEKNFFDEVTDETLQEMAGDISFAIENISRDEQLISSERLFHNLTSFVQVGIFRLDASMRLHYINEYGQNILSLPTPDSYPLWLTRIEQDVNQEIQKHWLETLLEDGNSRCEAKIKKDGRLLTLIFDACAEKNEAGSILGYIGTITDITNIKESEARLAYQAHYDQLTHLPNRTLLAINLEKALHHADQSKQRVALLTIDLDRFKDVNDSFGHSMGDELLVQVAERLRQHLPDPEQLSRIGGDEFTVLLNKNPSNEFINAIAYNINQLMRRPFHLSNARDVILGSSIGISLYPTQARSPEELVQKSDTAMYHAKNSGRNAYRYFSDDFSMIAEKRIDIEVRLKRALEQHEFRLFYQPQVDMNTGRIVGAEALIRWFDPKEGMISPIEFIPIAEETGLIKSIGQWVLQEACYQGKVWLQQGLPPITIAVNISTKQLHDQELLSNVTYTLAKSGFPATSLELELTESALMSRENESIAILQQIRQLGVRIAIDDFGTGYSSLSYLKKLPLDVLKIDKSFVDDIPLNRDDMEIAAAIVGMAHTLRLKVLAEGVENHDQLIFLKEKACHYYQGYLMSKPLPADEFAELLEQNHDRQTQKTPV